jgi:hypothetical protein
MGPGELGHPGRFRSRRDACAPRIGRSKNLFSRYRDRDVKLPIYASAGIPEAWLLDVSAERLDGHRHPTPDGYQDMRHLQWGEPVASQVPRPLGTAAFAGGEAGGSPLVARFSIPCLLPLRSRWDLSHSGPYPLGDINSFHGISPHSKVSGLPWSDQCNVRRGLA